MFEPKKIMSGFDWSDLEAFDGSTNMSEAFILSLHKSHTSLTKMGSQAVKIMSSLPILIR